nr:1-(5-phosphoribosyl)-5-[(5-phosphoribosylamino)methylideneamino]imidazole-4-carboxamide isomerase [uncultured Niameybacter sp.]
MQLYPAIDLKDGKCVRLVQGDYDAVTVFSEEPAQIAYRWEGEGGTYLHLVDLDGAKEGRSINEAAIKSIVEAVNIPIQLGGGIRTLEQIEEKLNLGVSRVILGSAAVKNKDLVKEAINRFGSQRIVVGVDAKGGQVAIEGWLEITTLSAIDFCMELKELGVTTIIYTDIAKDGMMEGPNVEETKALVEATDMKIIASGGIAKLEDLSAVEAVGVEGAIIGKALYVGAIKLEEAVKRFEIGHIKGGDTYVK